eukprot:1192386-Amphidinium_carterae.2
MEVNDIDTNSELILSKQRGALKWLVASKRRENDQARLSTPTKQKGEVAHVKKTSYYDHHHHHQHELLILVFVIAVQCVKCLTSSAFRQQEWVKFARQALITRGLIVELTANRSHQMSWDDCHNA